MDEKVCEMILIDCFTSKLNDECKCMQSLERNCGQNLNGCLQCFAKMRTKSTQDIYNKISKMSQLIMLLADLATQLVIKRKSLIIQMIEKIFFYGVIILWGALSLFAFRNVTKIIKKYRNVRLVEPDEKWSATIRTDFNQWDEKAMKIGCFLRFPYKIIAMLSILVGISFIIYFQTILKKVNKNIDKLFAKVIGRRLARLVYQIDDQQAVETIQTPIIISNHVNWFDIGYLLTYYFPISFVSKAEVQHAPLVGMVARYVQCVFLERQSATAREATLNKIKDRVEAYDKDPVNVNPLIIFPQGTTSNGRSIMKFKIGAFNDLAPITIFGLKYTCAGLDMGMQEITAIQHVILTLTLQPKLTVTSKQVSAEEGESAEQYMHRCQIQLSNLTSFPIYRTGVKEKIQLKQLREGRKTQ